MGFHLLLGLLLLHQPWEMELRWGYLPSLAEVEEEMQKQGKLRIRRCWRAEREHRQAQDNQYLIGEADPALGYNRLKCDS
jgi:hypothetical protein